MINDDIDRAAIKAGIASEFTAIDGSQKQTSLETKISLLAAMGDHCQSPFDDKTTLVPPVAVFKLSQDYIVTLSYPQTLNWQITCENGQEYQGNIANSDRIVLPSDLPLGYHQLTLLTNNQSDQTTIIIVPHRCFEPQCLIDKQKIWGVSLQLYTLRSEHNWGIGDFGDLHRIINDVSQRGGAFIGLNPIHALYPSNPASISPYSPSSRKWLNYIYIDVNDIPEFQHSEAAQQWLASPLIKTTLHHAKVAEWIDYNAVYQLKLEALSLAYHYFLQHAEQSRQNEFNEFLAQSGDSLLQQATFDALHQYLSQIDDKHWGWHVWPEEYQDYDNEAVQQFRQTHQNQIQFFCWLQWIAFQQLAKCHAHCHQNNMPIGLYLDLAVSVSEGSADSWSDKSLYSLLASIGAPPDPLGPLGQNWGLLPMNPHVLQAQAYRPFIELLRSNMTFSGALRIDHVMSLLRLWWIPYGQASEQGAYVAYPVDDLLGILALESQRYRCLIIGEDLGTVPPEIVNKLKDVSVYSYRVLYFQRGHHHDFFLPQDYREKAMAVINTHDLPTLHGFWVNNDLLLGSTLKLYPDRAELNQLYHDRYADKQGLLQALDYVGFTLSEDPEQTLTLPMNHELSLSIFRYISSSQSLLFSLQLEDLLGILLPVNIPGTSLEYPNWRRKLTLSLETLFNNEESNHLFDEINQIRKASTSAS